MKEEIYVSVDVEADGPVPGLNSMLSFGAAAFIIDPLTIEGWRQLSNFRGVLKPLPGAAQDPETMAWWKTQPVAWLQTTEGAEDPQVVMELFIQWIKGLPGKPVLVGYPITFDFQFIYYYTIKFTGFPAPFGFSGLDIKTLAMAKMHSTYREAVKKKMPKQWFVGAPAHTHDALDDAIGQGVLLMNLLMDPQKV